MSKNPAAVALGKLGRAKNTKAQQAASRANGAKGGRPAKHRCKCGAAGAALRQRRAAIMWYECQECGARGTLQSIETKEARFL